MTAMERSISHFSALLMKLNGADKSTMTVTKVQIYNTLTVQIYESLCFKYL